jgi:hypothetical protein
MFNKSNTSARGVSPSTTSARTATGALNGCSDNAHESLHCQLLGLGSIDARGTYNSPAFSHYLKLYDSPPNAQRESRTSCLNCVPSWISIFLGVIERVIGRLTDRRGKGRVGGILYPAFPHIHLLTCSYTAVTTLYLLHVLRWH